MKARHQDVLLCVLMSFLILVVLSFAGFSAYMIIDANSDGAQYLPSASGATTMRTLFSTVAQVVDLSSMNIDTDIDARAHRCPWLITFYSDGCGHCRSAAPGLANVARQFARAGDVTFGAEEIAQDGLTGTSYADDAGVRAVLGHDVVLQGAVNCVQFGPACSKEGVRGVPTIKLFLPRRLPTSSATKSDGETLWGRKQEVNVGASDVMLPGVGRAWSDYKRASLSGWSEADTQYCRDLYRSQVQKKQVLIASAAGGGGTTGRNDSSALSSKAPGRGSNSPNTAGAFTETRDFVLTDVANAFFHTMYSEVTLKGVPDKASHTALVDFLWRVHDHLPGLSTSGLILFLAKNPPETTTFNTTAWQETVREAGIPIRGTPEDLQWSTCQGSSWEYRGFPCGMWLLYHTLTVAESRLEMSAVAETGAIATSTSSTPATDAGTANVSAGKDPAAPRRDAVLQDILDYARYFFTCEPCRVHFMRFTPTAHEDPALQLWRLHNKVNYFLGRPQAGRGDSGASDPLVPKRQFPTVLECPRCYKAPEKMPAQVTDRHISDDDFDVPNVLDFLRRRYEWQSAKLWAGHTQTSHAPHRGAAGITPRQNRSKTPMGLSALLTMVTVVLFVGSGLAYSLSRHRSHVRAARRASKPLV